MPSPLRAFRVLRAISATLIYSSITLAEASRRRLTPQRADRIVRRWSEVLLEQAKVTVTVRGLEQITQGETYVVMSNHQSNFDIPVLLAHLPLTLRMVAKIELFRVPVWGHAMQAAGFVPIHRGDRTKSMEDLKVAQAAIRSGISIWIAPEGTRSPDGRLLEFKRGGFHLATAVKARILPVTIDGSNRTLPARSLAIEPGHTTTLTIHPPIDPKSFGKDRQGLAAAVRMAIEGPLVQRSE